MVQLYVRTPFVIIVGVSNKSGSVIAGMVAQLITELWLSCTGQGAQRAPDSSIGFVVERLKRRKQNGTDQKNNINNRTK